MVLLITSNNAEAPAARVTSAEDNLMTAMQVAVTEYNVESKCASSGNIFFLFNRWQVKKLHVRLFGILGDNRHRNTEKQMHVGRRHREMEDLAQWQEGRRKQKGAKAKAMDNKGQKGGQSEIGLNDPRLGKNGLGASYLHICVSSDNLQLFASRQP